MKKLPKIYQNNEKTINTNKKVCYLKTEDKTNNEKKVKETLDIIFTSRSYSYNIPVIIETNEKVYNTTIVTRTNESIYTLEDEKINISNIKNITIK